jgi:type VI secretion system protein ImpJ
MAGNGRVVWSEGMFLRPQHFQQQDRHVEDLLRGVIGALGGHLWGFAGLEINRELLRDGKLALASASGLFPDGTPFAIPEDAPPPLPLDVPEGTRGALVSLVLPVRQPGAVEVARREEGDGVARWTAAEIEVADANAGSAERAGIEVGRLRLGYSLEGEEKAGFVGIGIARIAEVRPNREVVLDEGYIPPCLAAAVSPVLGALMTDLRGRLRARGEELAARVGGGGRQGVSDISLFLLLQIVNRAEPLIAHFLDSGPIHPERLFAACVALAGELAAYSSERRRPPAFPPYRHHDPQNSFVPVEIELRRALSVAIDYAAIQIPLEENQRWGIRVAQVADRSLFSAATFVLAVRADMSAESLRRHFPAQVKIGPVEKIADLVNVALPGIAVRPLSAAPRQLPFHAGFTYFELDRRAEYFKLLPRSTGMAIHLAGNFPKVEMECWAIKDAGA